MSDIGLLILRLAFAGSMIMAHGWEKMMNFADKVVEFPDPLGFGSQASLAMVVFAEVVCSFLVLIGLFTRLTAIPVVINMAVAFLIIHGDDPFGKKELALMYMAAFATLVFTGPGKYSIDRR